MSIKNLLSSQPKPWADLKADTLDLVGALTAGSIDTPDLTVDQLNFDPQAVNPGGALSLWADSVDGNKVKQGNNVLTMFDGLKPIPLDNSVPIFVGAQNQLLDASALIMGGLAADEMSGLSLINAKTPEGLILQVTGNLDATNIINLTKNDSAGRSLIHHSISNDPFPDGLGGLYTGLGPEFKAGANESDGDGYSQASEGLKVYSTDSANDAMDLTHYSKLIAKPRVFEIGENLGVGFVDSLKHDIVNQRFSVNWGLNDFLVSSTAVEVTTKISCDILEALTGGGMAVTAPSGDLTISATLGDVLIEGATINNTGLKVDEIAEATLANNIQFLNDIQVDNILEKTAANGVSIDSVLLKDSICKAPLGVTIGSDDALNRITNYESAIVSVTFSGLWAAPIVRNILQEKIITPAGSFCRISSINADGDITAAENSVGPVVTSTGNALGLPFRPSTNMVSSMAIVLDNVTIQNGLVRVSTAGFLTIYATINSGNFSNVGNGGLLTGFCINYNVD